MTARPSHHAFVAPQSRPTNQIRAVMMFPRARSIFLVDGRRRFSVAHLLWAIVAMFITLPLIERVPLGKALEVFLFCAILIAGINTVGGRTRSHLAAALLAVATMLSRWLNHLWPAIVPPEFYLLGAIAFVSFVTLHLFAFVIKSRQVSSEVLHASITIYLLFAVIWAFVYTILARWEPGAIVFNSPYEHKPELASFTALYFSMQMLTGVVFDDIVPAANLTRTMALFQSISGNLYLTILVGRLVGLYSSDAASNDLA